MSLLNHALNYADRGWTIIPIRHRSPTGKQPALSGWKQYQDRRPTQAELRRWFADERPPDGLAVLLGNASGGLVCRDFDRLDAYQRWAARYPELAAMLPTVATARGRHVYFRSSWSGYQDLGENGELRGMSGVYVLLPPSVHPSGAVYRWIVPLPKGELPEIDPFEAGLGETECTECTEETEDTERTEDTEDIREQGGTHGVSLSVLSVTHDTFGTLPDAIERAVVDTLPTGAGQRNRAIFELARALKAIPSLVDAEAADLRPIVTHWHRRAIDAIRTKPFDETWSDFLAGWRQVRFPKYADALNVVMERALANPMPKVAERYEAAETRQLIAVCRELQRYAGQAPFFLACRTAGRLVGLDHVTASRRLRMLEADGILRVERPSRPNRAARYRYLPEEQG